VIRISLTIFACFAFALPADAQNDDAAYCATLGDYATKYLSNNGGEGGTRPDFVTVEAIADCRKGNTAAGIAALEKKIRSKGFTPPKR
jgi:hypothetical protein